MFSSIAPHMRVQRATTDMLTARCFNLCFWRLSSWKQNVGTCATRTTALPHKTTSLARQIHQLCQCSFASHAPNGLSHAHTYTHALAHAHAYTPTHPASHMRTRTHLRACPRNRKDLRFNQCFRQLPSPLRVQRATTDMLTARCFNL
jgi:hypothetical protein